MHERCAVCHLRFEREQGYFLGAIYINYGVTVVLALIGSFALEYWGRPVADAATGAVDRVLQPFPGGILSPLAWLWLAFDYIFDPVEDERPGG
jgi:hypothetical protein